tara:strand:- start:491 stop:958 length:468 start_codon:yes stop_codon:yes gene_type:complete
MYTLYSDKTNLFECDIQLEGASLNDASARLIIESDGTNLLYNGEIDSQGNCKINVPKLKNIIKESGNIKLEVIADDMYFNPWNSEFDLKASKKLTVEVKQQTKTPIIESKPKVKVNIIAETPQKSKRKVVESRKQKTNKNILTKKDIQTLLNRFK